jgi:hypothetical protein
VVDPQRDIVHDGQRSKPLGQATQFNGRQSLHSLFLSARILFRPGPHRRWNLIATKTDCPLGNTRAVAGGLFIARSI